MNINEIILYFNFGIFILLFYSMIIYGYNCLNEKKHNITTEDILFIETILD
jgi:hypothetical protein